MVQKDFKLNLFLKVLIRVFLFFFIVIGSVFISNPIHDFLIEVLNYKNPEGFFVASWAEWSLAWFLTFTLFGGIIFGALGRKMDYFFILILIALDVWEWTGTENVTLIIWSALIGAIILGNLIGFILKLLRQRFLPKWEI